MFLGKSGVKNQGYDCIEMEASAFLAVSQYYGCALGYLVYSADYIGKKWDSRDWYNAKETQLELFDLALEILQNIN